jgi:hypothetical protein
MVATLSVVRTFVPIIAHVFCEVNGLKFRLFSISADRPVHEDNQINKYKCAPLMGGMWKNDLLINGRDVLSRKS